MPKKKELIEFLGKHVKDCVDDFSGVVTSIRLNIDGSAQALVVAKGEPLKAGIEAWCHIARIQILKDKPIQLPNGNIKPDRFTMGFAKKP